MGKTVSFLVDVVVVWIVLEASVVIWSNDHVCVVPLMVTTVVMRDGTEDVVVLGMDTGGRMMVDVTVPMVVVRGGGRMLVSRAKVKDVAEDETCWLEKLMMVVVTVGDRHVSRGIVKSSRSSRRAW